MNDKEIAKETCNILIEKFNAFVKKWVDECVENGFDPNYLYSLTLFNDNLGYGCDGYTGVGGLSDYSVEQRELMIDGIRELHEERMRESVGLVKVQCDCGNIGWIPEELLDEVTMCPVCSGEVEQPICDKCKQLH